MSRPNCNRDSLVCPAITWAESEIGRLRAALAEIRARAPTMNNGGAWAGGLAALCLMSKKEQGADK